MLGADLTPSLEPSMTKAKALTEEQWLAGNEDWPLLRHLQQHCLVSRMRGGKRRLRLYACACCRRAWHLFGERERTIVEVAERAADGRASRSELAEAEQSAMGVVEEATAQVRSLGAGTGPAAAEARMRMILAYALQAATSNRLSLAAGTPAMSVESALGLWRQSQGGATSKQDELRPFADLLRDIFRNPFRDALPFDRAAFAPKGSQVANIAQTIYEEQRWDDLPVLADALEEAGCADADLLGHCRAPRSHTRGCHVVDLCLGLS
jgi:hypothetical protein